MKHSKQASEDSLIQPQFVMDARKAEKVQKGNQLVIGVDPAHKGKDRYCYCLA
jgi:hypothetical protein